MPPGGVGAAGLAQRSAANMSVLRGLWTRRRPAARSGPGTAVVRQVDPAVRATLVARLRDKQAAGMAISADVRRAAAALAIAESTVWRWLSVSGDSSRSRRGYELTEADRDAYLDWCGNVAALRRDRITRGEPVPPLRTLQRAFAEQMSPGERAAAVEGAEGGAGTRCICGGRRRRATPGGKAIIKSFRCWSPRRVGFGRVSRG